jgi:F0F1-type ATP synthase membrane subunit b/b'
MNKIRMSVVSIILVISLLFGGTAYAQDEELPDPGITPDSPFYFLDTLGKKLGLIFAFGDEAKAKQALEYAEERLAEARAMALQSKLEEMAQAAGEYEQFMAMVNQRMQAAAQNNASTNVSEKVALSAQKHLAIMDRVRDRVPEEGREALDRVRERSLKEQQNALRALARNRVERATEINLNGIQQRLHRALEKASENATDEVANALEDAEKLRRFGEEISEIARGLSDNTTTVDELVARATSVHLEVLARVHERAPEPAREAIENAMANALQNREQSIERLRNRVPTANISENITGLEQIQAEVMERIQNRIWERLQETTDNQSLEQVQERIQEQLNERLKQQRQEQEQISNLKPETHRSNISDNASQADTGKGK